MGTERLKSEGKTEPKLAKLRNSWRFPAKYLTSWAPCVDGRKSRD